MKRGDLVAVALPGDFGKPRPALVMQSDRFEDLATVSVLPLSSDVRDLPLFRITLEPDGENGLRKTSQVMVDKPQTISRAKAGQVIGTVDPGTLLQVERSLAIFLGIAK